jgi:hypothetical protein
MTSLLQAGELPFSSPYWDRTLFGLFVPQALNIGALIARLFAEFAKLTCVQQVTW